MNRGSKKGVLAALGAPVALTLTLGTLPAYAGGDTSDEVELTTTSTEESDKQHDDKQDGGSKTDARAEGDVRADDKADVRTQADAKASGGSEVESDGETADAHAVGKADAKAKAETKAKADADANVDARTDGQDRDDRAERNKGEHDGSSDNAVRGNSAADIILRGCYLSSSKDISYIDFVGDGAAAGKDETIGTTGFDLTAVAGIDAITSVEVKAGTTVKTFVIDCAADGTGTGDDTGHPDEGDSGKDEDHSDEGDSGKGDKDESEKGAPGNSAAVITLEGCYLSSSKDISYIDFMGEGSAAGKDESIDTEELDLTTVEGIEGITSIEVKSGTTVETFAVDCAADTGDETGNGDENGNGDETGDENGNGDETGDENGNGDEKGDQEKGPEDKGDESEGENESKDDSATGDSDAEAGADVDADVVAGAQGSAGGGNGAAVDAQGNSVLGAEQQSAYQPAAAQQTGDMVLPQTGAEDNKLLALGGLGMVLAGAAAMVGRRRFGQGS